MKEFNYNFKKKFGQNFIKNDEVIQRILSYVDLSMDDLVIEIGPGGGALTTELAKKCNVLAYEIDTDLKPILEKKINFENVSIIWDDFLNRDVLNDIKKNSYKNLYVIANLPYYITTPIIEKIISENLNVKQIIVMVQKEVGERFSAMPGTKDYNSLTVFLNYYFDISKCFVVKRNCFVPEPNVDSMVICFKRKEKIIFLKDKELFFKLIRDSFKYKRKNLKNNLNFYNLKKVETILNKYNYSLLSRAEQIPIEIFCEIANNL